MDRLRHVLAGWVCALAALAAVVSAPSAAFGAIIETGTLTNISSDDSSTEYYYEWDSSPGNTTILELDFQLEPGAAAPDAFDLIDNVYYAGYYKPDPSASNEYFGSCGGYICLAQTLNPSPGLTRIRYTTFWGDKGDTIVSPLSPIMIDVTAYFSDAFRTEPFLASYRVLAVPEPGVWALMLIGFFGLGSQLRRRRSVVGGLTTGGG